MSEEPVLDAVGLVVKAVGALMVAEGSAVAGASSGDIDVSLLSYTRCCGRDAHLSQTEIPS